MWPCNNKSYDEIHFNSIYLCHFSTCEIDTKSVAVHYHNYMFLISVIQMEGCIMLHIINFTANWLCTKISKLKYLQIWPLQVCIKNIKDMDAKSI